jgi:hypothetical protein
LLSSISRFLVIEREALGMATGHEETVAFVEAALTRMEGERRAPPGHLGLLDEAGT